MKHLLLYFMICLACGCTYGQAKLGNVTVAELEQKMHPADTAAVAAFLFKKCKSSLIYLDYSGYMIKTEVEVKAKIYKKSGLEYANDIIHYYSGKSAKEIVKIDNAFTYNLVNGKVEKTKLKSEGEFDEVITKTIKAKKIMMPDVKVGSIVEFKYTLTSPFIATIRPWHFQQEIPVDHSELITLIPDYFVFSPVFRGYFTPQVTREKSNGGNKIAYVMKDLPALKEEPFMSNIENYGAAVEHEINLIQIPGQLTQNFSGTWDDVVKRIYEDEDFGRELRKTGYFEEDINALVKGIAKQEDIMLAIFNYVKNKVTWNKYIGATCYDGVKDAYTKKTGNVAEINLMLTSMLRSAGVDANPVLVSTRDNNIPLFPTNSAFDYVICKATVGGKTIMLDATSKWAVPDVLPERAINWTGRVIRENGTSTTIDLAPKFISKEIMSITAALNAEGQCTGKARNQYFDHNAFLFREDYQEDMGEDAYIETLEKKHKGTEINAFKVSNQKDAAKGVTEDFDFKCKDAGEIIGDKMYVNPMLFCAAGPNPFTAEKREYPVDFIFPYEDKYVFNITLPEGYVVESMPGALSLSMEQGMGNFKYMVHQQGNIIQLLVINILSQAVIPAQYYDTLRHYFQKITEKQNEKIVLKKA